MAESVVAIIPAAGSGTRLGAAMPKQYLELAGSSILQRSIDAMLRQTQVVAAVVVLTPGDRWFSSLAAAQDQRVTRVRGGNSRAESVAAGVSYVCEHYGVGTWALVHDAARPLVSDQDVQALISAVVPAGVGGILAAPVTDTIKRCDAKHRVAATVPRDGLWRAQTPQLFPAGELQLALSQAAIDGYGVTDEASAMEQAGHACQLIAAASANPKITYASDIPIAEALLAVAESPPLDS